MKDNIWYTYSLNPSDNVICGTQKKFCSNFFDIYDVMICRFFLQKCFREHLKNDFHFHKRFLEKSSGLTCLLTIPRHTYNNSNRAKNIFAVPVTRPLQASKQLKLVFKDFSFIDSIVNPVYFILLCSGLILFANKG